MLGSTFVPKALSNVKVDPSSESRWFNVSIHKNDNIYDTLNKIDCEVFVTTFIDFN